MTVEIREQEEAYKKYLLDHKDIIEKLQWSLIESITSFIYLEYISRIQKKEIPVLRYLVPSIRSVENIISEESQLMKVISVNILDKILFSEWMYDSGLCSTAVYDMLKEGESVHNLKWVLNNYILPNVRRVIPEFFMKKFSIGESNTGVFVEDYGIDIYPGGFTDDHYLWLFEEVVVSFAIHASSKASIEEEVANPANINLYRRDIVSINNENAACPLLITTPIVENATAMNLICKSTVTEIIDHTEDLYRLKTSEYNQVKVYRFNEE